MPPLRLVPYGPPAMRALRDAVVEAKDSDALAPVTVAVPSNYAGLSLRRTLGVGALSLEAVSGRQGLVNVRFFVFARIAELLGAPLLAAANRRPLGAAIRTEAIRAALAAEPGLFREVAEHPATERSLDATFRELHQATPEALDRVAARSERAAHVVRLFHDVKERCADYYDEEELTFAAAEAVRDGSPALADVGHVILYLPRRLSPAELALAQALAATGGLTVIAGLTGDAEADALARELTARLEGALGSAGNLELDQPAVATAIASATDAEEEVRSVLRLIMERLDHGTPLHRIAVLYPTAQPYALLAHEQFEAAKVPHNSPAIRTLAQTLSGRTLLGLLRLRDRGLRRDDVMDWLGAAPILERPGGSLAPAQRWDALSRAAGVVKGPEQWRLRLAQHRQRLLRQQERLKRTDDEEWRARRLQVDLDHIDRLSTFVSDLGKRTDPGPLSTWKDFARWGRDLLERYLGGEGHLQHPGTDATDEIEAHRAVEAALDALSPLDEIRAGTQETVFRRALERELEAPAGRIGRFGDGVFISRVSDAMGADFDVIFLLGMTEGLMPPRTRDDPLLPDRERAAGGDEMPLRASRHAEQRRDYLAALATGTERIIVYPRSDLRGQRGRLPAPWLLETASRLEGRKLFSADLDSLLSRPWLTFVPSFESALAGRDEEGLPVASAQEYDLRSLLHWQATGAKITGHYLAAGRPEFRAGLEADSSRQSSDFTRWDGHVADGEDLTPSAERPISPTALQNYAACPFRYFLGNVLRIAETQKPEDTLSLSPIDRGNLIHDALEKFIRAAPKRTAADQPWSDAERASLRKIAEALCEEAEKSGVTGPPLLWRLDRASVLRDLDGFLDRDEDLRREHGVVPEAVELSFGLPDAEQEALTIELDGGRSVAFRGRIDRVDRATDGSRLVVIDYKTGSSNPYKTLDKDSTKRGQLLQLPIYALAAQARYDSAPVAAFYWFVSERSDYELKGYAIEPPVMERFHETLSVILGGIGGGLFPARPGERRRDNFENCSYCPYDRVCPRERDRIWQRKRATSELREYLDLAEPID